MCANSTPGPTGDIRVLFSDVDRTLLTHGHVLPERVVDSVHRARDEGLLVILASARSPAALLPFAERLGVTDIAIGFNGAWIGDLASGTTLHRETLPRDDALLAVRLAMKAGLHPLWFGNDTVHVVGRNTAALREVAITGEDLHVEGSPDELPGRPGKLMCVREDLEDDSGFAMLRSALADCLSVASSHPRLLEISPVGTSKMQALAKVAAHLGLTRSEIAAAGDAENDLAMLRGAGTVVTVANALPEILMLAQFVGPSCDDGGMAEALSWLIQRNRSGTATASPSDPDRGCHHSAAPSG